MQMVAEDFKNLALLGEVSRNWRYLSSLPCVTEVVPNDLLVQTWHRLHHSESKYHSELANRLVTNGGVL